MRRRGLEMRAATASALAALFAFGASNAAAEGATALIADPAAYLAAAPENAPPAPGPDGLPDGRIAQNPGGDIRAAWFAEPTTRYAHAILGDAIEAGALVIETASGERLRHVLDDDHVFEDRTPHLTDLDGDGRIEALAIKASNRLGAAVAVYGVRNGVLSEIAVGPFIGRANRWLNIAGIADFLGEGDLQIAYVQTPHIGGTLRLFRYRGGALEQATELFGFSNHAIGAREQRLSAVADIDGDGLPELAAPDERRRSLKLVSFKTGAAVVVGRAYTPAPIEGPVLFRDGGFEMALTDGTVARVTF